MTIRIILQSVCAVILLCFGCLNTPGYNCLCASLTNYEVHPTTVTPDGIKVDDSGFVVNLDLLDQETISLEQCLSLSIDRTGFTIKIAPDWFTSPSSGNEGFPCNLRPSECSTAPCACAGAVQPPNTVVLPPSLLAYRHEMIHLVTHANHGDPQFELCENTQPLTGN